MNLDNQIFRVACTPPDHKTGDDMGAILNSMGIDYQEFTTRQLEDSSLMSGINLLFINCPGPEPTWRSANNVRELVDSGGAIYVSCYAHKWIDFVFPGYLEFHSDGDIQNQLIAKVVDWQLQEFLGVVDQIYLRYNTHWHGIKKIIGNREIIREYLRGVRAGWFEEEPLLVSFPYGEGFVIFTTFHNSSQVNALEHRLLEYLVLKPMMSKRSFQSKTIMQRGKYRPLREYLGALSVGEESKMYQFYNKESSDLKFVFNWEGNATAKVWIYNPANRRVIEESVRNSPYEFEISNAQQGSWQFKMQIVDAPLMKFPFVIHVGKKDIVERQIEMDDRTVIYRFGPTDGEHYTKEETLDGIPVGESASFNSRFKNPIQTHQTPFENPFQAPFQDPFSGSNSVPKSPFENIFNAKTRDEQIKSSNLLVDCEYNPKYNFRTGITVNLELLEPIRKSLGKYNLTFGKEIIIGNRLLTPHLNDILGYEVGLDEGNAIITLLDEQRLAVTDISSYGIAAANYFGGDYKPEPLLKNIAVAFNFPLIIQLGKNKNILIGFHL